MELQCMPYKRGPYPDQTGYVGGYRITSYFGGRPNPFTGRPSYHGGQDIGIPNGVPYYAPWDGTAFPIWDSGGGGRWTTIYHRYSSARVGFGHQQGYAPGWVAGGRYDVKAGDLIGYCNSTGASTGAHLHFAYDSEDSNTSYDDPYDILMNAARAGRYPGGTTTIPPVITPPPPPPGEPDDMFSDDDRKLLQAVNHYVNPMGANNLIEKLAEFEDGTRLLNMMGQTKIITAMKDEEILNAVNSGKFDSRDYAFCYEGGPDTYMWVDTPDGRKRQWIQSHATLMDLVRTKLNPAIQVFPADARARHGAELGDCGPRYQP